jgi:hypothetical protein
MVDPSLWNEAVERELPTTEWRAAIWRFPTLFYLLCLAFGVIFASIGFDHLIFPTGSIPRVQASLVALAGLWFLGVSLASMFLIARTVALRNDALIFTSRRRNLSVPRGDLLSVGAVPLDWNRLLPWRVQSVNGSIRIAARFNEMEDLWEAFYLNSPGADIDPPFPWWSGR